MAVLTRKVDVKSRVTLPEIFAGRNVIIEPVKEDEVRIRIVKERKRVPSLNRLLSKVTKKNLHGEIDSGLPVGAES